MVLRSFDASSSSAVMPSSRIRARKFLFWGAVLDVRRKPLARNDVVQQDGLEVLRREQLLGRDAQFADQGQKVLILGGEDSHRAEAAAVEVGLQARHLNGGLQNAEVLVVVDNLEDCRQLGSGAARREGGGECTRGEGRETAHCA